MVIKKVTYLLFIMLLVSCKGSVSEKELKEYVNSPENGLVRQKKFGEKIFTLTYIPSEIFHNDSNSKTNFNCEYIYFILRVKTLTNNSPLKSNSESEYNNKLYYIQTKLKSDFTISCNNQSAQECVFLSYEDDHNIGNEIKLLLAFKRSTTPCTYFVDYEDKLFGIGIMHFVFNKRDLNNIPELKIS